MADSKCEKCNKAAASSRIRVAGQSVYLCGNCVEKWLWARDKAVAEAFGTFIGKASK